MTQPAEHLGRLILGSTRQYASRPSMRYRAAGTWRSMTYAELGARIRSVAQALLEAGVSPGDKVGIFSPNRPEWSVADFAVLTVGAVSVPIYATNTAAQAAFIINDAGLGLLFVGGQEQYDKVAAERDRTPGLKQVVAFDDATVLAGADDRHLSEVVAAAVPETSTDLDARLADASAQDVATLVYTSGTTGDPKGAILTHANVLHQLRALDERFDVGPEDVSLCFLPLSHVYERGWSFYVFAHGGENVYVEDPRRVAEVMVEVRPTTMVSVPRLYEKIHATVLARVEEGSPTRARLFRWALDVGGRYQRRLASGRPPGPVLRTEHALADRLVLGRIREAVGGPKKVFSAGGAPLSRSIEEFFFAAGLFVCQGYGLTETTAMVTCNYPGAFRFGTVGTPVLGTELRIAADGEIQVRGGNVMVGYFGRPGETAEAFEDGWLRTGDVGSIDADGFLTVTDRIKDLIITSQGKNVAPQHVESLLAADPFIEQVVVVGDRRRYLAALVEPTFPVLERWAEEQGVAWATRTELVSRPEVVALYDARIADASRELAGYERVKRFTLMPDEFTQSGGQLTPTMKLRRRIIEAQFADVVDAMYGSDVAATAAG